MHERYFDPKNDVAFKKVFSHPGILIHFLNTTLRLPDSRKIVSLDYLPQEQLPRIVTEKRGVVDIKVKDASGKTYIIEMQNTYSEALNNRLEAYASLAISNQLEVGGNYCDIQPVVLVCITNEMRISTNPDVISFHETRDRKTQEQIFKNLSYVVIKLQKFSKETEDELTTMEDYWLHYLKCSSKIDHLPRNLKEQEIKEAYTILERFNWSKEERAEYFKTQLAIDAEQATRESFYEKGIEKGIEKGKTAKQIEIARKMLLDNFDLEFISKYSGLDVQEIVGLKKE